MADNAIQIAAHRHTGDVPTPPGAVVLHRTWFCSMCNRWVCEVCHGDTGPAVATS